MNTRRFVAACLALATIGSPLLADAQTLPPELPQQVTIVVPYPAGGSTDVLARGIGQKLSENLKIRVIVDNRPGGSAQIAAHVVKQGPTDGSMLFMGEIGSFAMNKALYSKLNYDIQKDFVPVARVATAPTLLVVPASSPFNSLPEFVNGARQRVVNAASQGTGSGGHLFIEIFQREAGVKLNHVPYRGSAPALTDLVGGQVDVLLDPAASSGNFVKDGKLKVLAVGGGQRVSVFPQAPTLKEAGYGGSNLGTWFGIVAKAGTPRATVQRLSDEIVRAAQSPDLAKRYAEQWIDMAPMNAGEFQRFLDSEVARWGKVIQEASIKLD
ncbi:Tripartite-type tricarboxylate transporter, receptor component TctC [Variovorax sp. HW608]|uniref:Bug family tripartite tricarboxylate transporter substrate binding protein n=1 Tax=Variovorax sp. HW608 TaxID=1034889 RepID=UPI00081FB70D|nr:tripartite tricarboxylate transporter substrate binding protein [Variovorax sp. HW608]SCK14220.1 Tripartite-type tricarboxylate transporter, receptor component TctC [Variovorax sp. HW608]